MPSEMRIAICIGGPWDGLSELVPISAVDGALLRKPVPSQDEGKMIDVAGLEAVYELRGQRWIFKRTERTEKKP